MSGSVCGGCWASTFFLPGETIEARFHAYQGYIPRGDGRRTFCLHLSGGVRGTKEDLGGTSTLLLEMAGVGSVVDILFVLRDDFYSNHRLGAYTENV